MILLPIASKVELDFRPSSIKAEHCEQVRSDERFPHAQQIPHRNPYVHGVADDSTETQIENDRSDFMQRSLDARPSLVGNGRRQLQDDIESIRVRTKPPVEACPMQGVSFHFVLAVEGATRHWVETCPPIDHALPSRRVLLASRRVMPTAWTVLIPQVPMSRPIPMLVNLLLAGGYHPTLHMLQVDGVQTPRGLFGMIVGTEKAERAILAAQIHDVIRCRSIYQHVCWLGA